MSNPLYSPIPVATLICSIILAYLLDRYVPVYDLSSPLLVVVGAVTCGLAIVLAFYSIVFHARHNTTLMPGAIPRTLMTGGLFSLSRNPIYVLDVIIAASAALIFGSLSAFVAPLICFLVLNFVVIPFEERNLLQQFGQYYENYRKRVRRWL